jgi:hypothetical protein
MATMVMSLQGCIPAVRQSEKMLGRASGHVTCAHFRILYPTPLGPGAEEFMVERRAIVTSREVTSSHSCHLRGGGSSGYCGEVLIGFAGKK